MVLKVLNTPAPHTHTVIRLPYAMDLPPRYSLVGGKLGPETGFPSGRLSPDSGQSKIR